MSEQSRVWPAIARLPGERLLEGVPHTKADSIFSEPGVADACDVLTSTKDLNSSQRRAPIQEFVARAAFGKDGDRSQATLDALDRIASREITDSKTTALHASFMKSVLAERVATPPDQSESSMIEAEPVSAYSMSMNIEWATGLIDTDLGKSSRRRKMEKDEVMAHTVARLVSRNDPSDPKIIEAGAGIYNRFTDEDSSLVERIVGFKQIANGIDRAKVNTIGFNGTTRVSNMIIQAAGATLTAKVKPGEIETAIAFIDKLIDQEMQQAPHLRAMVPKNTMLRQNLCFRKETHSHAREMKLFGKDFSQTKAFNIEELKRQTSEIMTNLGRLRKYGIKPSYFANGFLIKTDQVWVFEDPQDRALINPMLDNFLADIKLYDQSNVENALTTDYESIEYGPNTRLIGKAVPLYQSMVMLPDGELAVSSSLGILPLRREYAAMDAESTYELMRLSLLTNFIDLVVPQKYTQDMPSVHSQRGFFGSMRNAVKFAKINDLLVPRIKLLRESTDVIEAEIRLEIEESRRQVREHGVIWHIRVLPKGYKASHQALEEAQKRGIILQEGETFVKTHTRGNPELGKIEGHKAKKSISLL
ncbi:MAG: hypothetical protein QFB86_02630 [Patescibacteria group bacterium]|nr:hypothetical protein [Patescibacteria group bacterium]